MIIEEIITSGDISLCALTPVNMSSNYIQWLNSKSLTQYMEARFQRYSLNDIHKFIEHCNSSPNSVLLGIFYQNKHIGNIKADINQHHKTAGIGILIGEKNMHGKGVGTSVIQMTCNFLFSTMQIYKINAGIYANNKPSINVFKKSGFDTEYIKKEHVINNNGSREDVILMVKYNAQ